jgi:hypothetical protein
MIAFVLQNCYFILVKSEKRAHFRHPVQIALTGQELPALGYASNEPRPSFTAQTENISSDGIGCVADRQIEQSSLVCCHVQLPEMPVGIPVLLKVQWVKKITPKRFRLGLKYLTS